MLKTCLQAHANITSRSGGAHNEIRRDNLWRSMRDLCKQSEQFKAVNMSTLQPRPTQLRNLGKTPLSNTYMSGKCNPKFQISTFMHRRMAPSRLQLHGRGDVRRTAGEQDSILHTSRSHVCCLSASGVGFGADSRYNCD